VENFKQRTQRKDHALRLSLAVALRKIKSLAELPDDELSLPSVQAGLATDGAMKNLSWDHKKVMKINYSKKTGEFDLNSTFFHSMMRKGDRGDWSNFSF
jgi:hypothetical protein